MDDRFNGALPLPAWELHITKPGNELRVEDGRLRAIASLDDDDDDVLALRLPSADLRGVTVTARLTDLPPAGARIGVRLSAGAAGAFDEITVDATGAVTVRSDVQSTPMQVIASPRDRLRARVTVDRVIFEIATAAKSGPFVEVAQVAARSYLQDAHAQAGPSLVGGGATGPTVARIFDEVRVARGDCDGICEPVYEDDIDDINPNWFVDAVAPTLVEEREGAFTIDLDGNAVAASGLFMFGLPDTDSFVERITTVALRVPPSTTGTQMFLVLQSIADTRYVGAKLNRDALIEHREPEVAAPAQVSVTMNGPLWVRTRVTANDIDIDVSDDGVLFTSRMSLTAPDFVDNAYFVVGANQFIPTDPVTLEVEHVIVEETSCVP